MRLSLLAALAGSALAADLRKRAPCFPFGTARLSPATPRLHTRESWWCGPELQYGFLGFSYPLEDADCDAESNSFEKINTDFSRMKRQFGATMVRIYAPECRDESIWRNLLRAGVANNLAIIPQVWWGFTSNQSLWLKTRAAILSVLSSEPLAPFVFHSLAFGSEPIGDHVDGGPDGFIADLNATRGMLAPYGLPISMSEDWDRPGTLASADRTALGPVGVKIAPLMDNLQLHPMPYYHANIYPSADGVWPYFEWYIDFVKRNLPGLPILITETQWSSMLGGAHDRGWGNPGEDIGNFTIFWDIVQGHCEFWRDNGVGWFAHVYDDSQEVGMGLIGEDGELKMDFDPPRC